MHHSTRESRQIKGGVYLHSPAPSPSVGLALLRFRLHIQDPDIEHDLFSRQGVIEINDGRTVGQRDDGERFPFGCRRNVSNPDFLGELTRGTDVFLLASYGPKAWSASSSTRFFSPACIPVRAFSNPGISCRAPWMYSLL